MNYSNIAKLKEFSDRVGEVYGMEDFPVFLYALVKMQKLENILELGTGTGSSTFWMAQACSENNTGSIITVNNGDHWPEIKTLDDNRLTEEEKSFATHRAYFDHMAKDFELAEHILLLEHTLPPFPTPDEGTKLDLLFSDYSHGPDAIIDLFSIYLPCMADNSHIFIDSAPTALPSFHLLENLIGYLNKGKVPLAIRELLTPETSDAVEKFVDTSRFTLVNITEARGGEQNSTAWIKIEPIDIRPQPFTEFH